jgi:hypothetical protein
MRLMWAAVLMLVALPALADEPLVYTGCIAKSNGSLYNVAVGTTPMQPCKAKDTQISWNMAGQPGPQGSPGTSIPQLLQLTVDCSQPNASINTALAQRADRLVVSISGTCEEEVVITRDDVTLQGVGTDPTITALPYSRNVVRIEGARRVVLRDLTLTGGGVAADALSVQNGASVNAYDLLLTDVRRGLAVGGNSAMSLYDSEIANITGNMGVAADYSHTFIIHSSIVVSGGYVLNLEGGEVYLSETTIAGGAVATYHTDLAFQQGHATETYWDVKFSRLEVAASDVGPMNITNGSALTIGFGTTVTGCLTASGGSTIGLAAELTINGGSHPGISLSDTSTVGTGGFSGEVTVTGYPFGISCASSPSVSQITEGLVLNGTTDCQRSQ